MAIEVKLPELGEGVTEGTVSQVLVSVGDRVEKGQSLLELESDKAVAEIPSEVAGEIKEIRVKEGQTVQVGHVIAIIEGNGAAAGKEEASSGNKAATQEKPKAAPAAKQEKSPAAPQESKKAEAKKPAKGASGGKQELRLPELGEGVTEGMVSQVLVAVGDRVEAGQGILELESEKAVAEIPAEAGGKVVELRVKEGQTVRVGDVFAIIEASGDAGKASEPAKDESKPAEQKRPARPQLQVLERPKEDAPAAKAPAARQASERGSASERATLAAPTVRRLARELGVNLEDVPTADDSGRVTTGDVRQFAEGGATPAPPAGGEVEKASAKGGVTAEGKWGVERREGMSQIRKKTAERMLANWTSIPHVTHHDSADVTEIENMRKKYGKQVEKAGGRLTVTAVLVKVVAEALKRFPKFNASLDMEAKEVIFKQYYHIGIAVDTPNGLLVPVIRDADQMSLTEICVAMPALAEKARDRKLSIDEMQGGTFTITNLGGIGGTSFTPIINGPEVSILGVSRSRIEPIHINGQFSPRMMMPLSLSYDHRIIDGAEAARFTRWVAEAIEQPWILFLDEA
jgi:pyruvate dehydrogenase E2 component (dihydrolipoamide acetyltransferase)